MKLHTQVVFLFNAVVIKYTNTYNWKAFRNLAAKFVTKQYYMLVHL